MMSKKILIAAVVGIIIICSAYYLARTQSEGYCLTDSDCIAYDSCCGNYECVNRHSENLKICNLACPPDSFTEVAVPECGCEKFSCS